MQQIRYPDEYRRQVVTSVLVDGMSYAEAARKYDVSPTTVRRWVLECRNARSGR